MCIKYVNHSRFAMYDNLEDLCAHLVIFKFDSRDICNAPIILKLEMKIFVILNRSVDGTILELIQWS